ncbi:hypothetical protein FRC02_005902 [Tulasnella sp. 418]|nr:hypothetical protein FRC02_005902 [Tulasnella sp. 418]
MSTQRIPPTCDCPHPSDCTHAVAAAWVTTTMPTTITPASTSNIPADSCSALREVTNNTTKVGKTKQQQQTQSSRKKKKAKPGASSSTQVSASNTVPDPSISCSIISITMTTVDNSVVMAGEDFKTRITAFIKIYGLLHLHGIATMQSQSLD